MINEIISAILQVVIFTLIPFLVYVINLRSAKGFFNYLGLYNPTRSAVYLSVLAAVLFLLGGIGIVLVNTEIKEVMLTPPSIAGKLRALGLNIKSLTILIIIAGIKTSLSEEILFRGFIAKRLSYRLGFRLENFLQALIFSFIHGLLFWT
jgi:membrane protease YdiL (CAAX protease family)